VFFLLAFAVDMTIYMTPGMSDFHPARRLNTEGLNFVYWLLWIIGDIIFMVIYKQKVVDKIPTLASKQGTADEFEGGIFDCCSDCDMCMHSWCCVGCRQAHNWQVSGVMDYYMAILVQVIAYFVDIFFCAGHFILAHYHGQMKLKRGIQPNLCCDCCCMLWCEPCIVGRAGLRLDQDCGVKVRCCCNVEQKTPVSPAVMGAVVGQPVVGQVVTVATPNAQNET